MRPLLLLLFRSPVCRRGLCRRLLPKRVAEGSAAWGRPKQYWPSNAPALSNCRGGCSRVRLVQLQLRELHDMRLRVRVR